MSHLTHWAALPTITIITHASTLRHAKKIKLLIAPADLQARSYAKHRSLRSVVSQCDLTWKPTTRYCLTMPPLQRHACCPSYLNNHSCCAHRQLTANHNTGSRHLALGPTRDGNQATQSPLWHSAKMPLAHTHKRSLLVAKKMGGEGNHETQQKHV